MSEQAVAVADEKPSEASAQDDLNALLSEYDEAAEPEKPAETPDDPEAKIKSAVQDALEERELKDQSTKDLASLVERIRGDINPEIADEDLVMGWVERQAQKDARYTRAWANRRRDPETWKKIEDHLAGEFSKRFQNLPDTRATEDREAVAASVRSASRQPEAPPDFGKMSDREFQQWKMAHR